MIVLFQRGIVDSNGDCILNGISDAVMNAARSENFVNFSNGRVATAGRFNA